MKQFIFHNAPDKQGMLTITGSEWRYLARVRRIRPGDGFPALLPDGRKVHVEVREAGRGSLLVQCLPPPAFGAAAFGAAAFGAAASGEAASGAAVPPLYLFQAMPKGAKIDLIVRQAAEAGIAAVIPFYAARSQRGGCSKDGGGQTRLTRLQKIIREARQQSGSAVDTSVEAPLDFDRMLRRWQELAAAPAALGEAAPAPTAPAAPGTPAAPAAPAAAIFLHELPLLETSLHEALAGNPAAVAVAVGPEGGFTAEEARRFITAGFTPIIVGNSILRTETAALYALAAVRTVLSERKTWNLAKK